MNLQQLLLPLSFILILSACAYEVPDMTPEEAKHINQLVHNMTPRCIGRYLVDLPEGFVLNEISRTEIEAVRIVITPEKESRFLTLFERRQATLQSQQLPVSGNPLLKEMVSLPDDALGGIFDRAESAASSGRAGRTLELWAWKNGFKIRADIDAFDGTYPEDAGSAFHRKSGNNTQAKLAHLSSIYKRIGGRPDAKTPTEQGVCFPNGFLRGAPTDAEWIDLNYHLSTAEDVYFRFISMSDIGAEENTLLDRGNEIDAMLKEVNGSTLRKGARTVNDQGVEEWLVMRESDPGVKDYHFVLEMNSLDGNAFKPSVSFEMSSGVRKPGLQPALEEIATRKPIAKATLGEAESVALWDKVSATIRPRPGAF
ncbi:MAG: hypothetical protein FHP92_17440 [Denitromonas halophila]|nr:MAG: hypothetical protein FHP92_17440 [Denitromonas halophila]